MSSKYPFIVGEPSIRELSGNRILVSGKCSNCFGRGRVYIRGDYESCYSCNSNFGIRSFIVQKEDDSKK
jgi:hypothetical protein